MWVFGGLRVCSQFIASGRKVTKYLPARAIPVGNIVFNGDEQYSTKNNLPDSLR